VEGHETHERFRSPTRSQVQSTAPRRFRRLRGSVGFGCGCTRRCLLLPMVGGRRRRHWDVESTGGPTARPKIAGRAGSKPSCDTMRWLWNSSPVRHSYAQPGRLRNRKYEVNIVFPFACRHELCKYFEREADVVSGRRLRLERVEFGASMINHAVRPVDRSMA